MPAIQQHRRLPVRCRELEPARCRLVRCVHLRDHAGKRAIAKGIFGERQHLGILTALRIEEFRGPEPDLFEPRCVKIEAGERPQHREAGAIGETGGDAGGEQCRGGVIAERRGRCRYFVKTAAIKASIGQPFIESCKTELQRRPARGLRARQLGAERGKLFGARPLG
jgi:hypothetical protein